MLSYHNDPTVKAKYTARFAEHREADAVIQGTGYAGGRGCFVGCTLQSYEHSRFPVELGWPEWLAHWADVVFEGVPASEAPQFGTDLLAAVPVGVDLDPLKHEIAIWRLERRRAALEGNDAEYAAQVKDALDKTIAYHRSPSVPAESAARSAARSAAESAAWSAAWSARSARSAAESAESAEFQAERDEMLRLLRALDEAGSNP